MDTTAGAWSRLQFAESLKTCPYDERTEFSGSHIRKLVNLLSVITTSFNLDVELVLEPELDTKINRKFKIQVLCICSSCH